MFSDFFQTKKGKIIICVIILIGLFVNFIFYDNNQNSLIINTAFVILSMLLIGTLTYGELSTKPVWRYLFFTFYVSAIFGMTYNYFFSYDLDRLWAWIIIILILSFNIYHIRQHGFTINRKRIFRITLTAIPLFILSFIPIIQIFLNFPLIFLAYIFKGFACSGDFIPTCAPTGIKGYLIFILWELFLAYTLTWFSFKKQKEERQEIIEQNIF